MTTVRVLVLPTPFYGANCLIVLPAGAREALVVDPSHGVLDGLAAALDAHGATVGAVLCTHGHADHVWDAAAVSRMGAAGPASPTPVWCPGPDLPRFEDPLPGTGMTPADAAGFGLVWERPEDVRALPAEAVELVPAVRTRMVPAPGHTEGSAVFLFDSDLTVADGREGAATAVVEDPHDPGPWALTGDVIFRDSVGRTDLPGGDEAQMRHTLRTLANAVDPATVLIPGHGPLTTWERELAVNPYVRRARRLG